MEQPAVQDSAVAQAAPEPEVQLDEIDETGEELPEQQTEPDEIEEELEGVKVRGKKDAVEKLKAERLMQADYTKKTQAAAEDRRSIETERATVQQQAKLYQEHLGVVADLVSMDKQIAQFKQVDWDALADADPVQAQKLDRQYRTLTETRQTRLNDLGQLQQRHALEQQQTTAKQIEQAADVLRREVPNWSPERDVKLREYAVKQGVPADGLRDLIVKAPQLGKILHKAELYDQLLSKRVAKPKPEAQEAPVTRINATRATATTDPATMSDKQFAEWRQRQIAQRR